MDYEHKAIKHCCNILIMCSYKTITDSVFASERLWEKFFERLQIIFIESIKS